MISNLVIHHLVISIWHLASGIWYPASGIRHPASGIRHPASLLAGRQAASLFPLPLHPQKTQ